MLSTTAEDIARITGGSLVGGARGDETVTGRARIDSREVTPGDLFAAFSGENVDGHDFLDAVQSSGAVISLVTRDVEVPAVRVQDVSAALTALATAQLDRARRESPQLKVLALTGSAGKTGTKDLLGALLAPIGPTVAPAGSLNNELGVPLTILSLDADTRFLVLEMGARGIGHIAHLTRIAPPDISLVLNVGTAHLGEFGSVEAIAQAKGEIIEALPATGRAVLSAEDSRVATMATRTEAPVISWGMDIGDLRATDVTLDDLARPSFRLDITRDLARIDGERVPAGSAPVSMQMLGEHQVSNALAAAAAALVVGADLEGIAAVLSAATPLSGQRMETATVRDVVVINDAYNANPDSMRLALRTLAHLGRGRRTIAVLGEMLELGEDSIRLHDEIGRLAVRLNISQLIVVGAGAASMHHGASLEGSFDGESVYVATPEDALAVLEQEVRPGDVVLLKSSRDAGLRLLGPRLLEHLGTITPGDRSQPEDSDRPLEGGSPA